MTISSTANKVVLYGNGVATGWPYKFPIPNQSQMAVIVTDPLGNQTTLTQSQYTVTGIGGKSGGSVTYPLAGSPLAALWSITILRTLPLVQQTDIVNQDGFFPDVLEATVDYLTMVDQQLSEALGRGVVFPVVDDQTTVSPVLPAAASRALKPLIFDGTGNAVVGQQAYQEPQTVLDTAKAVAEGLVAGVSGGYGYFLQDGVGATARTFQDKQRELLTATDYSVPTDGSDSFATLSNFVSEVSKRASAGGLVYAHIPACAAGRYNVSQRLLLNVSNVVWFIGAPIYCTGTARGHTLLVAYDTNIVPAQPLKNVIVYAPIGTIVDGNGAAQSFSYASGDGSDNTCAVRFNYVDGFYCRGLQAQNGPIDSFSVARSRNWEVDQCNFVGSASSRGGNGFTSTTDFGTYSETDPSTWGGGVVRSCRAWGNAAYGMSSFNCTNTRFVHCVSWGNGAAGGVGGGYSYEKSASDTYDTKRRFGGFYDCKAISNACYGIFIDAFGVTVDDACEIDGVSNPTGLADPNSLYGHGALVSLATDVYVGARISNPAKAGVAIFNGLSVEMRVTVGSIIRSPGTNAIYSRGASVLRVNPRVEIHNPGSTAILVSNSGTGYNPLGDSTLIIKGPTIRYSGGRAWDVSYVGYVYIDGVDGYAEDQIAGTTASQVDWATFLRLTNNTLADPTGKQATGYNITANVAKVVQYGNYADVSGGARLVNNAVTKVAIGDLP